MTVNVYKDWTGKEYETHEYAEGMAIKDCVQGIDWKHALVYCNGNKVNENYILKKEDVVAIREMPGATVFWTVVVLGAAFAVAEGISYAVTGKGLFQNLIEWLTPKIESPKQSQQEQIPTLKGAKNQNIAGHAVPLIIGQTRLTPYKVGNGYHTISNADDGEKQRYHCLFCLGYNDISAGMFKFGETDFAANGMSESYVNGDYVLSNAGNAIKNGAILDFNQRTPFANTNPILKISTQGDIDIYPQKVVEENIAKQIINANGEKLKFTRASACHPSKIQVEVAFNSLIAYNDKGEEINSSAEIGLGISFDGGTTFQPFGVISSAVYEVRSVDAQDQSQGISGTLGYSKITRKKNKQIRLYAERTITVQEAQAIENNADGYAWIRIERYDPDSTSSKVSNKAYISCIRTWVYDKEKSFEKINGSWVPLGGSLYPQIPIIEKVRDKTTRVAFELDATDNVVGELEAFNCMVVANCKTWDSELEQWSQGKTPTANPAANALNIMQSGMLGNFAYNNNKIDLMELGALYEFCEDADNERGCKFTVGTALVSKKKLGEVLDQIYNQCRAYRIVSGRKYSVFIDKPIDTPVCVLNNSNILKDGASNQKEFRELPDGFKIRFVNKNLGYDEDEVYVMFNPNKSYDYQTAIIEAIEMPFVTDPRQVAKNAWFEYAKRKLRPELWNRPVTTEANLIEIGSLVELQDDTIRVGIGNGGWIESLIVDSGLIVGFKISSKINISDLTKEYGAKITHSSDSSLPDIRVRKLNIVQAAYTDTFALDTAVAITDEHAPAEGDLVSIGEFGRETISAICLNKKDKGDGKFDLTLVPYDENIYTYDADAKVEFDPKVSGVQADVIDTDTTEYVKREEVIKAMAELAGGAYEEIGNPDTPVINKCSAGRDGIELGCAPLSYSGLNNALGKVHWQVAKAQSVPVSEIDTWAPLPDTPDLSAFYGFDRSVDGYPEAEDLNDVGSKWYFRAKVTNAYNKDSEWSVPVAVNVDNYGTWTVRDPDKVTDRVSGRTATLAFDQSNAATNRELYGDVYYKIEIRRGDSQSTDWFNPADDEDPYEDEQNYKDGGRSAEPSSTPSTVVTDEYLLAGKRTTHAFTQTLPLAGQNDQMYQYQWYYEGPSSGVNARVDSFGQPRKEGSGTAYSVATPNADWDSVSKVFGDQDSAHKVSGYFTEPNRGGDAWVHGVLGETGTDSYQTDVYRCGDREDVYELIKENGQDYSKAFYNGEYADIDEDGEFTLNGYSWTISGNHVTKEGDTNSYEIFAATKTISYSLLDGFNPVDTVYQYKVRAFNVYGSEIISWSDAKVFTVAALATSVKDVVEGSITHNKLGEGAVWVDNLAAGSITAEKMAVRDLFAITGVFGKIQNNQLKSSSHNYWDLETGEFLVGNEAAIQVPEPDEAEYIKFTPNAQGGSLSIKIANFIVKAITSIINGLFVVKNRSGATRNNIIAVNPEYDTTTKTTEAPANIETIPALTARINGNVQVKAVTVYDDNGDPITKNGDLSVDGSLSVGGQTAGNGLAVNGAITATGAISGASLTTTGGVTASSGLVLGQSFKCQGDGSHTQLEISSVYVSGTSLYINC